YIFFVVPRHPPPSTPLPYTTLFRSRPDLAVHPLELVQPHDRPPFRAHADRAHDLVRLRIEERDALGAVAHDEALAVVREPPALEIGRATSELQSRENLVCRLLLEKK